MKLTELITAIHALYIRLHAGEVAAWRELETWGAAAENLTRRREECICIQYQVFVVSSLYCPISVSKL